MVQRLCEIETYKTVAMLGLMESRRLGPRLAEIDGALNSLMDDMKGESAEAEETLKRLLGVSAELEMTLTQSTFRFGATRAYAAIVNQRIEVLRETRLGGRQTLAEFMMRRFDPAMRTVEATETRLDAMAHRAERAANLLTNPGRCGTLGPEPGAAGLDGPARGFATEVAAHGRGIVGGGDQLLRRQYPWLSDRAVL